MNEILIVAMAFVAIAVISYPILSPKLNPDGEDERAEDEGPAVPTELESLLAQRDGVYRAIREIEFDHQVGNMSAGDYQDLRERYKVKALATLKSIHDLEATMAANQVAAERSLEDGEADDAIEAAVRKRRGQRRDVRQAASCAKCGTDYEPGANFCSGCGSRLAARCDQCGEPYLPSDQFCAKCGTRLGKSRASALNRA